MILPPGAHGFPHIPYNLNLQLGNVGNTCNGPQDQNLGTERVGLPVPALLNPGT
jgi:hypothetical protein